VPPHSNSPAILATYEERRAAKYTAASSMPGCCRVSPHSVFPRCYSAADGSRLGRANLQHELLQARQPSSELLPPEERQCGWRVGGSELETTSELSAGLLPDGVGVFLSRACGLGSTEIMAHSGPGDLLASRPHAAVLAAPRVGYEPLPTSATLLLSLIRSAL
jgi:hypothetical protein